MKVKYKFCFFGDISGALTGKTIGGGELQVSLLASALAIQGHEVVIIDPFSTTSLNTSDGVSLINIPNWNKGYRGVRFLTNRIPALYKILKNQQADFYYVRMRSFLHLIPYFAAKKNKAAFIQALAEDIDVRSISNQLKYEFKTNTNLFKIFLVDLPSFLVTNFLIKHSNFVVRQHSGQELSNRIRGKEFIFPNIIDCRNLLAQDAPLKNYYVHVGTLNIRKGLATLENLINIIDNKTNIIIVGDTKDRKSEKIVSRLRQKENVKFTGRQDHQKTIELISNATALINTSYYEGFPNIFLEAWATGVPVISLYINPGNVINEYSLGTFCQGDLAKMKSCIDSSDLQNSTPDKLISYIINNHDFTTAANRFISKLENA